MSVNVFCLWYVVSFKKNLLCVQDECTSPCEEEEIPEEEIQHFLAKHSHFVSQRHEYRQRLRRQFADLQLNRTAVEADSSSKS